MTFCHKIPVGTSIDKSKVKKNLSELNIYINHGKNYWN